MTNVAAREYKQERAYGVDRARGILIGLALSIPAWSLVAVGVAYVFR